jgi:glutamate synthase (NADPH/NADH) small chain
MVKSMNRQKMPTLKNPLESFNEVALGYTEEMAVLEAKRCLQCKNSPCVSGCPVNINIPGFIDKIKNHDFDRALDIISEANLFPAICGRVCPQELQCEKHCIRGFKGESIAIGNLERYVADHANKVLNYSIKENHIKVAIVGSGPSGLTCANELRKLGYDVTVFEALHLPGGVLAYGIPEFRLPKAIVKKEIDKLSQMGVKLITNVVIGKTITIDQLKAEGYEAIYLATGAGLPKFLGIEGENYNGVFSANEYLTRINLMKAYRSNSHTPIYTAKNICVIGGGNVAMDAARCAKRMGTENVYIVYRRGIEEMPARKEEILHAQEEGIIFKLLTNPLAIIGDETFHVTALKCNQSQLGEKDSSGRARPVAIPDSEFIIPCDAVVMALGNYPNPLLKLSTSNLITNLEGCIVVDDNLKTSIDGVYAGGDAVTGAATVILAMGAGKKAAKAINEAIQEKLYKKED